MPSAHPLLLFTESHRKKDRRSISKMGALLSLKLVVATILLLTSFASSALKLSDPLSDPTSSDTREDNPLPIKISSVQYDSVNVNIYDSQTTSGNKKIYFFSPIALLSHLNVVSIHDQTATRGILSVSFSIWNQDVRKKVAENLKQLLGQEIELSQVHVLPFNSARLTSKVQFADFSLNNEWVLNDNKPSLRFTLICPTREHCERVKTEMRINPKQFEHLQLDFKPQLNDDNCLNDGIGTFQGDLPLQVKALLANIETNFANKLNAIREETKKDSQVLADQIKVAEENLADTQRQLNEALAGIETLKNELNVVKQNAQSSKSKIEELTLSTAASSIGRMPGSCGDFQQIGHKKSGLFSIMESNKIVNVYCDFTKPSNDPALQKWIGYTDVKSLPTYFYAQKRSDFSTFGVEIPFELERLNVGGAMNTTTGKFTAPRKGVYFFTFSGVGVLPAGHGWLDVGLMVNGVHFGRANCDSHPGNEWETLSFQSTIELKAGDSVWLQIVGQQSSHLTDKGIDGQFTHFSGWLLQEELSL